MKLSSFQELIDRDEELCEELQFHVFKGALGEMVHHPLIIEIFYRPGKCALINESFRQKHELAKNYLAEKKWRSYIFLIERPYRLDALLKCAELGLKGNEYWKAVSLVWIDTENVHQHLGKWKRIWSINPAMRELIMDEEERAALADLPNEITVWRGTKHQRGINGLSWTLEKDRAIWFAKRHVLKRHKPRLVEGFVHKKHVLAYFLGRGEKEIVSMNVSVQNVVPLISESVAVRREGNHNG